MKLFNSGGHRDEYKLTDDGICIFLVCNQSLGIWQTMADNVSHPRRLDRKMELITHSFVLYLQYGRHDVKCKPLISYSTHAYDHISLYHIYCTENNFITRG